MLLKLHLIPQTSFNCNLRNILGEKWPELSRKIRNDHNRTCQFCGVKENAARRLYTHCHEVWEYDEKTGVQKLIGFECLCPDCHAVHHWEYSKIAGRNLKSLLRHACKVNKCSEEAFTTHIEEAKKLWLKRSSIEWKMDYGEWAYLIKI